MSAVVPYLFSSSGRVSTGMSQPALFITRAKHWLLSGIVRQWATPMSFPYSVMVLTMQIVDSGAFRILIGATLSPWVAKMGASYYPFSRKRPALGSIDIVKRVLNAFSNIIFRRRSLMKPIHVRVRMLAISK